MSDLENKVEVLRKHANQVVEVTARTVKDVQGAAKISAKLVTDIEAMDSVNSVKDAEALKASAEAIVIGIEDLRTALGDSWGPLWDVEEAVADDANYYYNEIVSLL